jgi:hypothetical protein
MTLAALSVGEKILILVFVVPPFLALTLFELITRQVEGRSDYYRFWERGAQAQPAPVRAETHRSRNQ